MSLTHSFNELQVYERHNFRTHQTGFPAVFTGARKSHLTPGLL